MTLEKYKEASAILEEMETVEHALDFAKNQDWRFCLDGFTDEEEKEFNFMIDASKELRGRMVQVIKDYHKELYEKFEKL